MNKFVYLAFCGALSLALGACSDNGPDNEDDDPDTTVSNGAFVVNAGQLYGNISGTLSYLNYETGKFTNDVFYDANGQYVGDTFQDGYIYGNKIFLAVTDSRVYHVVDKSTLKLITTQTPDATAGPRHFTSYNGYLYCTLYGSPGYLCKINPDTYACELLEVGPQPEYVVPFNGKLYVAVSDGYSTTFTESCVAVVDPTTFTIEKKITGVKNPVQLATNGNRLFLCYNGEYTANGQENYGIQEIVNDKLSGTVYPGTLMALNGNYLYCVNAAYGANEYTYTLVNIENGVSATWINPSEGVYSPTGIAVDPATTNVFILSYSEGEYGYPGYGDPGYMNVYTSGGSLLQKYTVGVGPVAVFFNIEE